MTSLYCQCMESRRVQPAPPRHLLHQQHQQQPRRQRQQQRPQQRPQQRRRQRVLQQLLRQQQQLRRPRQ
ncbi:unnamed protein product [Rotaria magnacalcarata]|uniref:Uncharacterized protein n=2 Tax=Rotaria magnacalcarata TaxID=392030 RepID=A0A8S2ZM95_9BILA|nr:unnamed protein product [Rotaria magnacalcarata]